MVLGPPLYSPFLQRSEGADVPETVLPLCGAHVYILAESSRCTFALGSCRLFGCFWFVGVLQGWLWDCACRGSACISLLYGLLCDACGLCNPLAGQSVQYPHCPFCCGAEPALSAPPILCDSLIGPYEPFWTDGPFCGSLSGCWHWHAGCQGTLAGPGVSAGLR